MLENLPLVYTFVYVRDLAASRSLYEDVFGFRPLEEDQVSVKYDAGQIILALNQAADYGIQLVEKDDSSLLTFYTPDLDFTRKALEAAGIAFGPTLRYEIGSTAEFYDLDGHCFTLYQPSDEALSWPSGAKIEAILDNRRYTDEEQTKEAYRNLAKSTMLYLFLFISDMDKAYSFYSGMLGLPILEEDPQSGVVKYDGGGIILATHLVAGDPHAKTTIDLQQHRGIAPTFLVQNLQDYCDIFSRASDLVQQPYWSQIGGVAAIADPDGHIFYLYQPSDEALSWPSGNRIKQFVVLNNH